MPGIDDIEIFDGPVQGATVSPITGSNRDTHLQTAKGMVRDRYIDPLVDQVTDTLKMKVFEALESVPGITSVAIAQVLAMADSRDPDDKKIFNQIVSRLNLPFDVRRTGDDYRVSKRFQGALGDNSNVGVSAYIPDQGDNQYRIEASKRFPDFLGGEANVSANMSAEGKPEIRASFVKRFAKGGGISDINIFKPVQKFVGGGGVIKKILSRKTYKAKNPYAGMTPAQKFNLYSRAEEVAINMRQAKQPGEDARRHFMKQGVTKDELQALGLSDLFKQKRVTQQEIMETIEDNRIVLEEKTSSERGAVGGPDVRFDTETLDYEEAHGYGSLGEDAYNEARSNPGNDRMYADIIAKAENWPDAESVFAEESKKFYKYIDGELDLDDLDDRFIDDIVEAHSDDLLARYNEDPLEVVSFSPEGSDRIYRLVGNEEQGYRPHGQDINAQTNEYMMDRYMPGNGIYSRSEAEVVLRAAAQDRGDLEFMDGDTQWSEYTVPGGENYTEYRFQLDPDAKELFSEGTHFPDDLNNIFHIRTTDRVGPNGEKVLFVEEIQSDWAQTGRSEGFMDQKAIDESQAALKSLLFEIDMFIEDPKLLKESGSFFGSRIKEARELAAMGPQYSASVINNLVQARRDFERSLGPSAVTTRLVDRVKKDFSFDQKIDWLNKNYSDTVAAALKKEGFPDSDVQDYIDGKWDEKWLSANDTGNTKKVSLLNYFDKLASTDARIVSDRRAAMGSPSPEFYRIKKARALEGSGSAKGEIDFDAMYDDVYVDLEKEVFKNMRAAGVSPDFPEWVETTIESSRPNVEKLEREKGKPSTGPFVTTTEGWNKLGVKRIMNKAAEEDYDMVAFSNGDIQFDRWGNENLKEQYDKTLPGVIKTVTGKRPDETIDIGEYEVPVIRLNDKVGKETIKERSLRPQKMFSSGVGITALGAGLLSGLASQEAEASGVGSIFSGPRISTRVPTAKAATENPLTDNLVINRRSLEDAPKAFDINAEYVSRYPTVRTDATTSAGRADAFTAEAVDNLIWLYNQAPTAVRNIGKNWYVGANKISAELAEKYDISRESASAVLAALSPQKDWYQNVSLAERVINGYKKSSGKVLDADSLEMARTIYSKPQFAENIKVMETTPFDELNDVQKAMYVRSLDQTHNDRGYQMINPNGDRVGQAFSDKTGEPKTTAWGSNAEIAKAIRVIEDPSIDNISQQMGGAHKVRNFFNNISDPQYAIDNPEVGDVTIDTHAVAADQIMPFSGNSEPVGAAFGTAKGVASSSQTGARGTYGLHADAYRIAARELGIQPRELQSVTWETVRSLFPKEFKTKGNVSEINEIWKLYNSGKLSKGLARELILDKAGGIPDPDWAAGLDTAASGQRGLGANTGELSFSGVPGGQTAGRANAGRNLIAAGFPIALISTLGIGYSDPSQAGVIDAVRKNVDEVLLQGQDSARGVGSLAGASGRTFKNQLDETVARVYDNLRTQKDQYGEPVFDQLPVGKIEGATGRSGASPIARYRMPEGYAGSLDELKRASPDLIEIAPDSTGAEYFSQKITSAKDANKYGASVYVYPENEYQQMRLFVTEDGSAGYALKPDGDVVSAFSAGKHKGVAQNILLHAVEQGGTKLDAFDTVLPDLYSTMGFRESGRLPWDDAQAPDEWNKAVFSAFNEGEPDVSFMAYNKDPAIPVEPRYANDYDAAMKAQGRDVARLASAYEKVASPQAEGVARMVEQGQISPEQADKYTNTIKAYKLFRTKGGNTDELFPLFVNANKPVRMGEWNPAESGSLTDAGKVKSSIGPLAYRPGWHAGDAPVATHIGGKSDSSLKAPDYRPADQVWAEVEMPADVDWQSVADSRMEYSKAGRPIPRTAQITDQIPEGGYYRYKTNPNMTGDWLIAGDMKVNRVLTPSEVYQINAERGVHDLPPVDENGKMLWSLALGSGLTAAGIAPEEAKADLLSKVPQKQAQQLQDNWSQIEANAQAVMGGMGVRSAPTAQAGLGGMGVRLAPQASDRPERVIQGPPRTFPVERPTPGLPSLIGQLGLGAMSEIAGGVLGGAAGLGEYVRGGGLLGQPAGEPATAESIRDVREGVGEYVGGLYDAGPEAQELGQEIMQNVGETVSPFIDYAMKGDITDEYGINMVPLIAQKLGIPAYELLEKLYYMMPEREQEAVKSGSDVYL